MKPNLLLLILALCTLNSCNVQNVKNGKKRPKVSQIQKKPSFGDKVKWFILGVLERDRDEQLRKPHGGGGPAIAPPGSDPSK